MVNTQIIKQLFDYYTNNYTNFCFHPLLPLSSTVTSCLWESFVLQILNLQTYFSSPERGLTARTVFCVLWSSRTSSPSTASTSSSSSSQRLQPTVEQMYRS